LLAKSIHVLVKGQNPLQQFPRSKSIKVYVGKRTSVIVSCRFPNSITTTCCGLVDDILTCQDSLPCR